MVMISPELPAQTEARLRGVFRACDVAWLPGVWAFVEGDAAWGRRDSLAGVRDEGQVSALCPAGPDAHERFSVFRVVLPRDADDSGFVGWLASRIKSTTGSGLFVICGQNQDRGGVFDYYGVPEAATEEVRAALEQWGDDADSLDGTVMRVVQSAPDARIGPETVFCFDVNGSALTARYGGGAVSEGWLVGTLDPDTATARFSYLQVGVDGAIDSGNSNAQLTRLPSGRWQMIEHFTWTAGSGTGTNVLEERPGLAEEQSDSEEFEATEGSTNLFR